MENLDKIACEKLVIMAARKEIAIDDILETDYDITDFKNVQTWLRMTHSYKSGIISSFEEKYDCFNICNMLIEARENQRIYNHKKEVLENSEVIDLDMSWDEPKTEIISVENIHDALTLSLANKAKVDIGYIAEASNTTKDEVIRQLKGLIYQNPETWNENPYEGWETSDEYLSGNMADKFKSARIANEKYNGLFENNVKAIHRIYPELPDVNEIYVALGTPWIPTTVIDEFIEYLLGKPANLDRTLYVTKHDPISGTWQTSNGGRYTTSSVAYTHIWGTTRCPALRILENCLNMKKIVIVDSKYGRKPDGKNGYFDVINHEETTLAQEKQKMMDKEFKEWIWTDHKRKRMLLDIYEKKYSSFIRRKYDGSYLTFPGMNSKVQLFDYQKDAVARILYSGNVLLAHDVGSGKTYEMIAAGMELRRIGLGKKILYVVPNNIVGQWVQTFHEMYSNANILVVEPGNFSAKKKEKMLSRIQNEDFDGIIMAYSCFERIHLSKKEKMGFLKEESLKNAKSKCAVSSNTSFNKRRSEELEKKIAGILTDNKEEGITFDMLNIDHLFLDEAHNYKNVPVNTRMTRVLGLNADGSKKCEEMMEKVQYIQKKHNGKGVVLATGTPITNSITEAYILQLYLQRGTLELLDIESFDSWAGMFSETVTEFEIDVTTNSYRFATRFSKFHNLPELSNLLSQIADFHQMDKQNGIPDFEGYTDVTIEKSKELDEYLHDISRRADDIRNNNVSIKDDNMLKITTDARKAALDMRLVDENEYEFKSESKVGKCALNIYKEYITGNSGLSTQLVFCDSSIPKNGFNMYDELKNRLVNMGIPSSEIAFIHDADSDKERNRLYEKVRKGEIRILIGSTFKLGIGVNVQERVVALHHLDIPWRPADMRQREGRILRQGNLNPSVRIYRYVTKGSFDAYSWQLLETKQKFISDILSGAMEERNSDEVNETVLSYAEIKALAIGQPEMKQRAELMNEVARLSILRHKNIALRLASEKELMEIPSILEIQQDNLKKAIEDEKYILSLDLTKDVPLSKSKKEELSESRKEIRELLDYSIKENALLPGERELMNYNGFKILLPKMMPADRPYIILEKTGRYTLEMGESNTGNLIRIDNFFTSFDKLVKERKDLIENTKERKKGLELELLKKDDTEEKIEILNKKINEINKRLGILL